MWVVFLHAVPHYLRCTRLEHGYYMIFSFRAKMIAACLRTGASRDDAA